jgi:ribosomal protein L19E
MHPSDSPIPDIISQKKKGRKKKRKRKGKKIYRPDKKGKFIHHVRVRCANCANNKKTNNAWKTPK